MFPFKYPVPQSDPPRPARETLPTMYDLPSEDPQKAGLPDEFHSLQPQLLSQTFRPPEYWPGNLFCGSDMNLYYDVRHPLWHKRPDWFGVVGVPRLYDEVDLRLSYVIWQEGVSPFVVTEFLSPGTEKEDLGANVLRTLPENGEGTEGNGQVLASETEDKSPGKWEVYEQVLRIPYYVVFSRYTNQLRVFKLVGGRYQELEGVDDRIWISEINLSLGLWQGDYAGIERLWLRWFDAQGSLILTDAETEYQRAEEQRQRAEQEYQRAEQEYQRAEQERQRAEEQRQYAEQERQRAEQVQTQLDSLIQKLRESGIDPDTFLNR